MNRNAAPSADDNQASRISISDDACGSKFCFELPFRRRPFRGTSVPAEMGSMKRSSQLAAWCVLVTLVFSLGSASAAELPNILFILTDDQGWTTLGSFGNEFVETPHLDALAASGMRFTNAYVTPQCTPTRASFMTGQHTARNQMWHVIGWYGTPWAPVTEPMFRVNLPRDQFNVAKGLQQAGYVTGNMGKWHLNRNGDGDYVRLYPEAAGLYGFDHVSDPPNPRYPGQGEKGVDWLTDEALEFIKENRDERWFCYMTHHTIHGPVLAPEELVQEYRDRGAPESGVHNATYLAAIKHLDNSIGRLMSGLDEMGLTDDTMVVFLTDNGGVYQEYATEPFLTHGKVDQLEVRAEQFSNAPLRAGKGSQYEGGIRVPCIVSWPGVVEPGTVNDTPIHVYDWLPTLLDAAGTKAPEDYVVDGVSLVPLLKGESIEERQLYWYLPLYDLRWGATPCSIVRDGDWKLIHYYGDRFEDGKYIPGEHIELFHLGEDLGETTNLADAHPDVAKRLQQDLHDWLTSIPAEIPQKNPHYDPERPLLETRRMPEWLEPLPGDEGSN